MVRAKLGKLPDRGKRFRNIDELKVAVRRQCETEWQSHAGRAWTDTDADPFKWMNSRPQRLAEADRHRADYLETVRVLVEAGRRTREFIAQRRSEKRPAGVLDWIAELLDGEAWRRFESAFPTVEQYETSRHEQLNRWATARRALVALVDDESLPPLNRKSTNRQLAIASLLCGNFPEVITNSFERVVRKGGGFTVAEVIRAEANAIREARFHSRGARPGKR
jgi:hypothetical protein